MSRVDAMMHEARQLDDSQHPCAPEQNFSLGIRCFKMAEHEQALAFIQRAAEQEHAKAQYFLGLIHEYNYINGLAHDVQRRKIVGDDYNYYSWGKGPAEVHQALLLQRDIAAQWYEKAAGNGYTRALIKTGRIPKPAEPSHEKSETFTLAEAYADENNPERDDCQAAQLFYDIASALQPGRKIDYDEDTSEQALALKKLAKMYGEGRGIKNGDDVVDLFIKAAHHGHCAAQYLAGHFYREGIACEQSDAQALAWYRKASELFNEHTLESHADENAREIALLRQTADARGFAAMRYWLLAKAADNNTDACYILGILFLVGIGTGKDHAEATRWIQKAAEDGDVNALRLMGYFAGHGNRGNPQNMNAAFRAKAARWIQKAAKDGVMKAQWTMGYLAEHGISGIRKSMNAAYRWRRKAAEQNLSYAEDARSDCRCFRNEEAKARFLKKFVKKGNSHAQYQLACLAKNLKRRTELFRQAAEQGNMRAQCELALLYCEGRGVAQDYAEAAYWFHKAADHVALKLHIEEALLSQSELGHLYREGKGVKRNMEQAVYWYEKTVKIFSWSPSMFALAMAYECGLEVAQDMEKAMRLYRGEEGELGTCPDEIAEFFIELLEDEAKNA